MKAKWIASGFLALTVTAGASAQVTIAVPNSPPRPARWTYCDLYPSRDRSLPYYVTPIFQRSEEAERLMRAPLSRIYQNAPVRDGYTLYDYVECSTYYSSRAEAEASRNGRIARASSVIHIGAAEQRAIAAQAAAAADEAAVRAATDIEVQRLGEHRRAEAERLARMRLAADRARRGRGCPLGPNAPVTCQ